MKSRTCFKCTDRQTRDVRILSEQAALDLDYRKWEKEVWSCTAGGEITVNRPQPIEGRPNAGVPIGLWCEVRKIFTMYPQVVVDLFAMFNG